MLRVILLACILVLAVAEPQEKMKSCRSLFSDNGLQCFKTDIPRTKAFGMDWKPDDSIMECFKLINKTENNMCAVATCIGEKKGFISADGAIDKKSLVSIFEKDFEMDPNLLASVKEICLSDDANYKKDDSTCELVGIQFCIHIQMLQSIDDWNDEGKCKGKKDLAEKCIQEMSDFIYE